VGVDPFWKEWTGLEAGVSAFDAYNSCGECVVNGRIYAQALEYPPFYSGNVDFDDEEIEVTDGGPFAFKQHGCYR
jgi:hypothetical protein